MINLLAVGSLIEDAGLAEAGIDLFIEAMPADVKRGVMLRNPLGGIEIDDGHENFFSTEFQVIVRNPNPINGYEIAKQIQSILKIEDLQLGDIFVSWMMPCHLPAQYPRGDADDIETAFDVRMGFAITA